MPQTGEMSCGFASNLRGALPNASCIGFTGTPSERTDANTRERQRRDLIPAWATPQVTDRKGDKG